MVHALLEELPPVCYAARHVSKADEVEVAALERPVRLTVIH